MDPSAIAREAVVPDQLPAGPPERFAYSYGVRDGNTLHISGIVSFNADGEIVGVDDVEAQATQIFENIKTILEAAGGTLDDLVSTTTYMTDPSLSLTINEVRCRYITGAVKPTSTLLTVAALARPEFLLEISAIATLTD
jgi:enamine deaminase RidA (YjgF/YER057c/UK114 family)